MDEDPTGNRLLDALPKEDLKRILAAGRSVSLDRGEVLFDRHQPVGEIYFPISCVASLLIELGDGSSVEMATIGREGLVGVCRFLGADIGLAKAIAQIPGRAVRVDSDAFLSEVDRSASLRRLLRGYTQALIVLMGQTVACNRAHTIQQRCARWLLLTHDRIDSDEVPLTQEFLAYMLGVRRQSVTEAAGRLQASGLISYRRGNVSIVDREGLRRAACECYEVITSEFQRLLPVPDGAASA
jgi:CRP-like cAMP-binding protein